MLYLGRLVIFILLISCGTSYGSQDNTYDDEYKNPNHTISYEDYKQSLSTGLLNLLTFLSSHYDEFRLPLRLTEITSQCLLNFCLLKLSSTFHHEYLFVYLLSAVVNFSYDLRTNQHNYEDLSLFIFTLIAQRMEHALSLFITYYLSVKLFSGICPICLEQMSTFINCAGCRRHWYCSACLRTWEAQSLLCPVCRQ